MAMDRIKRLFKKPASEDEDYVEIDVEQKETRSKIIVRPFMLKTFEDINPILESIRDGYTIAVIDIRQIKSKDIVELKRAISKIKKTADALNGHVAGFGENIVIVTPQFAEIYKPGSSLPQKNTDSDLI